MSTTPGINPLTPDIEEVRRSGDDAFEDPLAPAPSDDAGAGGSPPPADDDARPTSSLPRPDGARRIGSGVCGRRRSPSLLSADEAESWQETTAAMVIGAGLVGVSDAQLTYVRYS